MATSNHLLLQVRPVSVWRLDEGEQDFLGSNLTLDVSLVERPHQQDEHPFTGPSSDMSPPAYQESVGERWLLLTVDGAVEVPLGMQARVMYSPGGSGYVVPLDQGPLGREGGKRTQTGYLKLELAGNVDADDKEDLESILSSWTAFGGQYGGGTDAFEQSQERHGRLALVDDSGAVVGELESTIDLAEDPSMAAPSSAVHPNDADPFTSKEPVVVTLPSSPDGKPVASVTPLSHVYGNYGQSTSKIINGAEWISRGILVGSESLSARLQSSARSYVASRPATETPMVFTDKAKRRAETMQGATRKAVMYSGKATAVVGRAAMRVGDEIGKRTGVQSKGGGRGTPPTGFRGAVNKGITAFGTVATALEQGGKHLITTASDSANSVVEHRYGNEAGHMSRTFTHAAQGVALVYIDVRGVTHKALLRTAGKAAIKGRMSDGREVLLAPEGEMQAVEQGLAATVSEEEKKGGGLGASPGTTPRGSPRPPSARSIPSSPQLGAAGRNEGYDSAKSRWQRDDGRGSPVTGAAYGSSSPPSSTSNTGAAYGSATSTSKADLPPARAWDADASASLGAVYRNRYG